MGQPLLNVTKTERQALCNLFDALIATGGHLDLFERHAPGACDELVQWAVHHHFNVSRAVHPMSEDGTTCQVVRCRIDGTTMIVVYL